MTLLTILLLALITFITRYLFLERRLPLRLGPHLKQILSYSAPAVLTAIFAPILLVHDHQLNLSLSNNFYLHTLTSTTRQQVPLCLQAATIKTIFYFRKEKCSQI